MGVGRPRVIWGTLSGCSNSSDEFQDACGSVNRSRTGPAAKCGKSDEVKKVGTVSGIICLSTAQT